ncbi:class I SAM-dependent methyltransferase [Saccharothrix obliqua]|uniref:class I SAM-dependent methyltransferase n=1 Tax=Saccharothrix obliqua TaxID=2861747 RepID=UPI001C5E3851|nr:methyltransferase domain-containing protein [Saccharothrix obliqua]MBW4718808.1 methyltransferase domain-containing protein [Saccharothrix obliqua]
MTTVVNTDQAEAWNGYEGEHCALHDERYDAVDGGFNALLFAAAPVAAGDRVLDVGCGNGQLARQAARHARGGHVLGVDLSEPMLAKARERAREEGLTTVSFEFGDAQVHPFPDGAFDVVLSRFGVMFFADPVAAFANLARALRPGGRLGFVCRANFSGTDLGSVFDAMAPHVPRPTGPDGAGPTSLADPRHTADLLRRAGFSDIAATRVEVDQVWGADVADAARFLAEWGPVRHHLGLVDPAAATAARAALTAALGRFADAGGVRLRGAAWLVTATRPQAAVI